MSRTSFFVALALVVPATGFAQALPATAPGNSLQGVWKVTERTVTGGANPGPRAVLPNLYFFTQKHYSITAVNGAKPRTAYAPAKDPAKLTDAEKLARFEEWNMFTANSGTYEIRGSTITMHPLVAKNQGVMDGAPFDRSFSLEGNTLWLVQKDSTSETRSKLTRIE